jgi:hypothetical protein
MDSEVKNRFPSLWNAADQLLMLTGGAITPELAGAKRVLEAPVEWELESWRAEELPENLVTELQEGTAEFGIGGGSLSPEQAILTLREEKIREFKDELREISTRGLFEDERDALLSEIQAAREGFPDYVREHIGTTYILSPADFGSYVDQFLGDLTSGKFLSDFIDSLPSGREQKIVTQVISPTTAPAFLMHFRNQLRTGFAGFYQDYMNRVFTSPEELQTGLTKDLEKLFDKAADSAAFALGYSGPDWLSTKHHLMLYAAGYAIWHQGQRMATRTIISLIF